MLLEISLGQNKWHCDLNVRRKLVRVATVVTKSTSVSSKTAYLPVFVPELLVTNVAAPELDAFRKGRWTRIQW